MIVSVPLEVVEQDGGGRFHVAEVAEPGPPSRAKGPRVFDPGPRGPGRAGAGPRAPGGRAGPQGPGPRARARAQGAQGPLKKGPRAN